MRTHTPIFRLTAALTTAALLLGSTAMTAPARAQQAPDQAQPDQTQPDPPARVGRLARTTGSVSYHAAGDTQWTPATMNFPVASGSSFWTEPNAQAEIELSASRVGLAGGTEIDIGALDANGLRATLTQGQILLRPRDLAAGETWSVQTPRGTVTTAHPGRIAVSAGDTGSPSIVSVLEGEATVTGPGLEQTLTAGQAASITGTDTMQVSVGPAAPDAFANSGLVRDRPPLPPPANLQPVPPPPAIASIPGGDDLAGYGVWNTNPDYGAVWYPSVDPGWVPYRQGHWAFIPPWGWTWVDDAPWGFAPFHYGRWFQYRGRWGWTPGFEREGGFGYPVYAPALVTFLGIGVGVGIGLALGSRPIGWVPLGPREAYRPWFHASPRYLGAVNGGQASNVANAGGFRNRGAATMVPASAMTSSRSIRSVAQPIGPQTLAAARPLTGAHPVQPTLGTAGVTPTVARQMNLPPAGGGFVRPAAPGPAIVPHGAAPFPALRPPTAQVPAQTAPHFAAPVPQVHNPSLPTAAFPAPRPPAAQGPTQTAPHFAAPSGAAPVPQVHNPSLPAAAPHFSAPVPRPSVPVAPQPAPHFAAPPAVQHVAPPVVQRPAPQFSAPPQRAPAPVQHFQAPTPQVHTAPPPQVHAAPAPQSHPAPPPAPREKKPGER